MFKRSITILIWCLISVATNAQLSRQLGEVTVNSKRPLSEVGMQKTAIDSVALKENIALSMADVIGFNSSVFVKSSGRATLSTVTFRGAAPSHTSVTWNGLPINSPAMGMTDFSMIPAYFIDRSTLLYGSSSVNRSTGAIGGMVELSTNPNDIADGWGLQYVQGVGSFKTFDEFLRVSHASERWKFSTRAVVSSSANDFTFTNRDKKVNIYNDDYQIVSQYHPKERNKNGAFTDINLLQQIYFKPAHRQQLGLNVWYVNSHRQIPLTTVDYLVSRKYENKQTDRTLRSVLNYDIFNSKWRMKVLIGYCHSEISYDYGFSLNTDEIHKMITSRTYINSTYAKVDADWYARENFTTNLSANVTANHVDAADHAALAGALGYKKGRIDTDVALTARWQPISDLGISAVVRQDIIGSKLSSLTPAFFIDYIIYQPLNLTLKGSVSKNFHAPTLNDLYFMPGGNPGLKSEQGISYDGGVSMNAMIGNVMLSSSVTAYDSYIKDWILWLPTAKGFFSPQNLKNVHSYGCETTFALGMKPFDKATLDLKGSFAYTRSVNNGNALSEHDKSIGCQIPYVPKYSTAAYLTLGWRQWTFIYKFNYYSTRYTMSSGEREWSGSLKPYCMNNVALERKFNFTPLDLSLQIAVNNIFNKEYQTIMSHPMPGINFEVFVNIVPHFNSKNAK